MRLDHLLSKEKENDLDGSIVYFSMYFKQYIINLECRLTKEEQLYNTLIYGLIAQMVRAHA